MGALRLVFGDQLSGSIAALDGTDARDDSILMVEVIEECTVVPHHPQKIALVLSAMRHFAGELRARGFCVDYVTLDGPKNTGSFDGEIRRAVQRHRPARMVVTEPGEWRVQQMIESWRRQLPLDIEVREDGRFLASRARFAQWARGRKLWRLEHFYREMRREHDVLMEGGSPAGGAWNFDAENRRRLPGDVAIPPRRRFPPDRETLRVIELVRARFPGHFGNLDDFGWPVTRAQALLALEDFLDTGLRSFGDFQDAMKAGAPFLFHSLLAPALNLGLLLPREVCEAAERAWRDGKAPLNAVEGFIRQILGWREYVRGIYWQLMPGYARSNCLGASRRLPAFFWSGETEMRCLREALEHTRRHAYSHHIQRLMLTGNFALLAGIEPGEIERWYLAVYADAIAEWVEMPNTLGMAVFADGGRMASKPYAASGAYINRMSDFCGGCAYDVREKSGPKACPFNVLYWAFLIRNRQALEGNPRMAMPYRNLAAWSAARRSSCLAEADALLDRIGCSSQSVESPSNTIAPES